MDRPLPTRLLEISGDSYETRLIEPAPSSTGKYIALSHCWGKMKLLRTLKDNFNDHLTSIPFSTLPLTFQHAVQVTALLGYRYLWIDSLCIKQDDREDWEVECSRMQDNYENAAVVIAGPGAASSAAGFYRPRVQPPLPPVRLAGNNSGGEIVLISLSAASSAHHQRRPPREKASPLHTRGWILQERLLAPRVLYIGTTQVYFECKQCLFFESSWRPIDAGRTASEIDSKFVLDLHCNSDAERYYRWYRVVRTFTACQLTHTSDTLPALSGLARRCAALLSDRYLAGLWEKDILHGLIWHLATPIAGRLPQYRAPSWSWASVDFEVGFDLAVYLHDIRQAKTAPLVEISHAATEALGLDTFGEVSSGYIVLVGSLIPITVLSASSTTSTPGPTAKPRLIVCVHGHRIANFFPDYSHQLSPLSPSALEPTSKSTTVHSIFFLPLLHSKTGSVLKFCGLAVQRLPEAEEERENEGGGEEQRIAGAREKYIRLGLIHATRAPSRCECADKNGEDGVHGMPWVAYPKREIVLL
ncbi:hypothetical protein LTR62_002272 [Meristemomyces frigidus]|uniref:Heterokaryon incompatibility domain-containing protein n=1 Tax=Meristemomyces frigidus TaxID=1508187 RepID=A0AAN7TG73_9PEZI|nr:hypothetical protein LTR62_002272 [Meristemomyces frigidus]